jgi:hypothetical protein
MPIAIRDPQTSFVGDPRLIAFLMTGILFVDFVLPFGIAAGILYAAVLVLTLWSSDRRIPLLVMGTGIALTVGGHFLPSSGESPMVDILNRLLALSAILVTGGLVLLRRRTEARQRRHVEHLEQMLARVSALRGLVPLCACCKKIRGGTGEWDDWELYIQAHSEARFTHGLCPDCLTLLYGPARCGPAEDDTSHVEASEPAYSVAHPSPSLPPRCGRPSPPPAP